MKHGSKFIKARGKLAISAEPAKPDKPLEALRSRIAGSASYFHEFAGGSVPFRIAPGMICSKYTDAKSGAGYIRLVNSKTDAPSSGRTGGYSIELPDAVGTAASGHRVAVNVVVRAAGGANSRFALAYSTNEVRNSDGAGITPVQNGRCSRWNTTYQ